MLAIGRKVHGLNPGQGQWIFKGNKNFLEEKYGHWRHVVIFYGTLKIPSKYEQR
jgi:hypothetical protein